MLFSTKNIITGNNYNRPKLHKQQIHAWHSVRGRCEWPYYITHHTKRKVVRQQAVFSSPYDKIPEIPYLLSFFNTLTSCTGDSYYKQTCLKQPQNQNPFQHTVPIPPSRCFYLLEFPVAQQTRNIKRRRTESTHANIVQPEIFFQKRKK